MNDLVHFLERHLHRGRQNAIKRDVLAGWLGVPVRDIKAQAEEARLAGIPLCYSTDAEHGGLYLAATPGEIEEGLAKLTRLALSILRERAALKRALRKTLEKQTQQEMFA